MGLWFILGLWYYELNQIIFKVLHLLQLNEIISQRIVITIQYTLFERLHHVSVIIPVPPQPVPPRPPITISTPRPHVIASNRIRLYERLRYCAVGKRIQIAD